MKKQYLKYLLLTICLGIFVNIVEAQTTKKKTTRTSTKRASTRKTASSKTKAKIQPTAPQIDTVAAVVAAWAASTPWREGRRSASGRRPCSAAPPLPSVELPS